MSKLLRIREQIQSVTRIQKLTNTMRLIAATKVYHAKKEAEASRPFADRLVSLLVRIREQMRFEDIQSPLVDLHEVKTVAVVVIAGDRGLCGAYNANIMRLAVKYVSQLRAEDKQFRLHLVGNKAITFFSRSDFPAFRTYPNIAHHPSTEDTGEPLYQVIADDILTPFLVGEVSQVEVIYTRFVSLLSGRATRQTLLPIDPETLDADDEVRRLPEVEDSLASYHKQPEFVPQVIFSQAPERLIELFLPLYLSSEILHALQEATASEHASRSSAMSAATDHAEEQLNALHITYNKVRQSEITGQLLDVINGASTSTI